MANSVSDTRSDEYTSYLSGAGGLRAIAQLPYRAHLRSLRLGRTLEIGCGVGRNFAGLPSGSVGVDHNERSVAVCRAAGHEAYTPADFASAYAGRQPTFEAILVAHVLEHLETAQAVTLVESYVGYLRPGARIVAITPQERGFRGDASHVAFCDFDVNRSIIERAGFRQTAAYSFPFPRAAGRVFRYNEFVTIGERA